MAQASVKSDGDNFQILPVACFMSRLSCVMIATVTRRQVQAATW